MTPAHLRSITRGCGWPGCEKRATHTLFNAYNAPCGSYCGRHAQLALRKFQREHEAPKEPRDPR